MRLKRTVARRAAFWLSLCTAAALMFGCGSSAADDARTDPSVPVADISATASTDTAETKAAETPSDSADGAASAETSDSASDYDTFSDAEILHNNDYFIQIGKIVYFRVDSPVVAASHALWGQFHSDYGYEPVIDQSFLYAYNTETGDTTSVTDDHGFGRIGWAGGRLYATAYDSMNDELVTNVIEHDGDHMTVLTPGRLEGVSNRYRKLVAYDASQTDDNGIPRERLTVLDLTRQQDPVVLEGSSYPIVKVFEDGLVYETTEVHDTMTTDSGLTFSSGNGDLTYAVHYLDFESMLTFDLGELPYEQEDYLNSMYLGQMELQDGELTAVAEGRSGTGNMLVSSYFVQARVKKEGSLHRLGESFDQPSQEEGDLMDSFVLDKSGRPVWTRESACEPYLDVYGTSVYTSHEDGSAWKFKTKLPEITEDYRLISNSMEHAVMIGGEFYGIYNYTRYNPAYSVGWRDGYDCLESRYLHISPETGDVDVLGEAVNEENCTFLAQCFLTTDAPDTGDFTIAYEPLLFIGYDDEELMQRYGLDGEEEFYIFPEGSYANSDYNNGRMYLTTIRETTPLEGYRYDEDGHLEQTAGDANLMRDMLIEEDQRRVDAQELLENNCDGFPGFGPDTSEWSLDGYLAQLTIDPETGDVTHIKRFYIP